MAKPRPRAGKGLLVVRWFPVKDCGSYPYLEKEESRFVEERLIPGVGPRNIDGRHEISGDK